MDIDMIKAGKHSLEAEKKTLQVRYDGVSLKLKLKLTSMISWQVSKPSRLCNQRLKWVHYWKRTDFHYWCREWAIVRQIEGKTRKEIDSNKVFKKKYVLEKIDVIFPVKVDDVKLKMESLIFLVQKLSLRFFYCLAYCAERSNGNTAQGFSGNFGDIMAHHLSNCIVYCWRRNYYQR